MRHLFFEKLVQGCENCFQYRRIHLGIISDILLNKSVLCFNTSKAVFFVVECRNLTSDLAQKLVVLLEVPMKNKFSYLSLSFFVASVCAGCASVPSDAPPEVKNAATELERSKDLDTAAHFPNTHDQAKRSFSESVTAFNDSKEKGADSETLRARSIALANDSRLRSAGANQLTRNMKEWDGDIKSLNENYSIADLVSRNTQLSEELSKMRSGSDKAASANFQTNQALFARISTFRMSSTPVYFELGSAVVEDQYLAGIEEIAQVGKLDDRLVFRVAGFSDFSGSEEINEKLSSQRAENVASLLRGHGIDSSRISAEGMGGRFAAETWAPASMQLDRKVVVTVSADQTK